MASRRPSDSRRAEALEALAGARFDVLVIGGGITGAGIARDAALRGLRTALVERDDYASGTSSRSSRLVHGGVRYLEHGALALVLEASAERRTLLRIAPHLVRPLAFTWPVYRGARVARWKLAAGLTLYDALALFRNVGRHERLTARPLLEHEPRLRREGLRGGARYWDAATDDARLTLATVRAALEAGAVAVNHMEAVALLEEDGRVTGARVRDTLTAEVLEVSARVVVSAAGPWSDAVARLAPGRTNEPSTRRVRGSRGAHVAVPRARVGNVSACTLLAPQDGRVTFVLPAGELAILGTTDGYTDVSPDDVRASESDVAYLLAVANHYFPAAGLGRAEVIAAWAGIRPLTAGDAARADPGRASREHHVHMLAPGCLQITGGKLTTYRAMARDTVDAVERTLGRRPGRAPTDAQPLYGGKVDIPRARALARAAIGDDAVAHHLVDAHGAHWHTVWALAERDPALRAPIQPGHPYLLAELRYAVEEEQALTLADLLVRRVPLAFATRDNGREAARHVAPAVAGWLGWSDAEREAGLAAYAREVERMFTVDP